MVEAAAGLSHCDEPQAGELVVHERGIHRPSRGGPASGSGNFEAVVLATSAQTSSAFTLLQAQGEPPEFGPPLHLHRDAAEAFYVLEGEYLMFLEDQQTLFARPEPLFT